MRTVLNNNFSDMLYSSEVDSSRLLKFSTVVDPYQFKFSKLSQFCTFKSINVRDIGFYYEYERKTFFYLETENAQAAARLAQCPEVAQLEFAIVGLGEVSQLQSIQKIQENNSIVVRSKGIRQIKEDEIMGAFGHFGMIISYKQVSGSEAIIKYLAQSYAENCLHMCQNLEYYTVEGLASIHEERPPTQQTTKIPLFKLSHRLMDDDKLAQFATVKSKLNKSDKPIEESSFNIQETVRSLGMSNSVQFQTGNFEELFNTNHTSNLPFPIEDLAEIKRLKESKIHKKHHEDLNKPMLFSSDEDDDGFKSLI